MNLTISSIISNTFPLRSSYLKTIGRPDAPGLQHVFYCDLNHDIPLCGLINLPSRKEDYPYYSFLRESEKSIRGFGKRALDNFKRSGYISEFTIGEEKYYVGKGCLFNKNYEPLLLTTVQISDPEEIVRRRLDQSSMKIFIKREIFTEEFKENNRTFVNRVVNNVLPELVLLEIPIFIKKDICMYVKPEIDTSLTIEQINEKFKEDLENLQIIEVN